jgi:hypothetical protein
MLMGDGSLMTVVCRKWKKLAKIWFVTLLSGDFENESREKGTI